MLRNVINMFLLQMSANVFIFRCFVWILVAHPFQILTSVAHVDAQLAEMALWLAERRPEMASKATKKTRQPALQPCTTWLAGFPQQKMFASLMIQIPPTLRLGSCVFSGFSIYGSKMVPCCGRSGL